MKDVNEHDTVCDILSQGKRNES